MFLCVQNCQGFVYETKYTNDPFRDFIEKTIGKVVVIGVY